MIFFSSIFFYNRKLWFASGWKFMMRQVFFITLKDCNHGYKNVCIDDWLVFLLFYYHYYVIIQDIQINWIRMNYIYPPAFTREGRLKVKSTLSGCLDLERTRTLAEWKFNWHFSSINIFVSENEIPATCNIMGTLYPQYKACHYYRLE